MKNKDNWSILVHFLNHLTAPPFHPFLFIYPSDYTELSHGMNKALKLVKIGHYLSFLFYLCTINYS